MPTGLRNATQMFQHFMDQVCYMYIDNVRTDCQSDTRSRGAQDTPVSLVITFCAVWYINQSC